MNRKKDIKNFNDHYEQHDPDYVLFDPFSDNCFSWNRNTKVVMFENRIKEINGHQFKDCDFEKVILNDGLERIDSFAFANNKFESIYIPDSVFGIGDHAFDSKTIKEIRIPIHLLNRLISFNLPLINVFKIKDKEIIGYQQINRNDEWNIQQGYKTINDCYARRIKLYIDSKEFDYKILEQFDNIESLHITNKDALFKYDSSYRFEGRIVERIYVNKRNTFFSVKGGLLVDTIHKLPIVYENKDEIVVNPLINDPDLYLPVNRRYHKRHYFYTSYNFTTNPNYVKKAEGLIEHRWTGHIVYIPNQKEVLLYGVARFSERVFLNHNELERIVVCSEHNEEIDYYSLYHAIAEYHRSEEFYSRDNPLFVVLPIYMEKVIKKSTSAKNLSPYINADPNKSKLVIIFQDVEEPVVCVQ